MSPINVYVELRGAWRLFATCPDAATAANLAMSWASICAGTRFAVGNTTDSIRPVNL